ncbi:hypothetical protein DRO37_01300 [Candidatus Bathyarchaeota archaeon]|nr:MAG: hypothetical protein DRO37_01300 [Candidatus Bathyarchaeota archaeon]
MTVKEMAERYIKKMSKALEDVEIIGCASLDTRRVDEVIDEAKRYFEDAKYYLGRGHFETSLASIAYSEGLLDALRMLGLVKFKWG